MPRLFTPQWVLALKLALLAVFAALVVLIVLLWRWNIVTSPWRGEVDVSIDQVVPFVTPATPVAPAAVAAMGS